MESDPEFCSSNNFVLESAGGPKEIRAAAFRADSFAA
jgi:hypothetical protein